MAWSPDLILRMKWRTWGSYKRWFYLISISVWLELELNFAGQWSAGAGVGTPGLYDHVWFIYSRYMGVSKMKNVFVHLYYFISLAFVSSCRSFKKAPRVCHSAFNTVAPQHRRSASLCLQIGLCYLDTSDYPYPSCVLKAISLSVQRILFKLFSILVKMSYSNAHRQTALMFNASWNIQMRAHHISLLSGWGYVKRASNTNCHIFSLFWRMLGRQPAECSISWSVMRREMMYSHLWSSAAFINWID